MSRMSKTLDVQEFYPAEMDVAAVEQTSDEVRLKYMSGLTVVIVRIADRNLPTSIVLMSGGYRIFLSLENALICS